MQRLTHDQIWSLFLLLFDNEAPHALEVLCAEATKLAAEREVQRLETLGAIVVHIPESGVDLRELERAVIVSALERTNGVQTKAAKLLGITARTLNYKMSTHHIIYEGVTLAELAAKQLAAADERRADKHQEQLAKREAQWKKQRALRMNRD